MTNKEIRDKFNFNGMFLESNKQVLGSYFDSIQDLTRKDERERVINWGNLPISELEKLWQLAVEEKRYAEASFILYLINVREDYGKIHEVIQRDKLGMGGESIVSVLIEAYNQLKTP